MRLIFALVLFIGVALSGFAVYTFQQTVNDYQTRLAEAEKNARPPVALVKIIVAAKPLEFGETIELEDLREVEWPENAVPEGAFLTIDQLVGAEGMEPRYIMRPVDKDEVIMASRVTAFGQDAGIRSRLSPGMRAFTIRVDAASGVSGFVQPGDKVDIYWTGQSPTGPITRLLLEGISVIAIDQSADESQNIAQLAGTITVEVSPEVVARLAQAQSTGRLALSLRGTDDISATDAAVEVDQSDVTGFVQEQVAPEAKKCFLTVTRAGQQEKIEVDCP